MNSCARFIESVEGDGKDPKISKAKWFASENRYSYWNVDRGIPFHPFFDHSPHINLDKQTVSYFVENHEDGDVAYKMDLATGKYYTSRPYCSVEDIWEQYDDSLYAPNFTSGIVPRTLDQTGRPLEVIVFGHRRQEEEVPGEYLYTAKVVGAVIHQECINYPCYAGQGWLSKLLLIAVNPMHSTLTGVNDLVDLREEVNWDYARAYLQNRLGHKYISGRYYPSVRLVGEIKPQFALNFAVNHIRQIGERELATVKNGCHKLYHELWKKVGNPMHVVGKKIKKFMEENEYWSRENMKMTRMQREQRNLFMDNFLRRKLKMNTRQKEIYSNIRTIHRLFGNQLKTCFEFVIPSHANQNPEKHWFFAYLSLFYKLHKIDKMYSCAQGNWVHESLTSSGVHLEKFKDSLDRCTPAEYDSSFHKALRLNQQLKKAGHRYMKYITYDSSPFGTHHKIYNWVVDQNNFHQCEENDYKQYIKKMSLFPEQMSWPSVLSQQFSERDTLIY